ncbi:tetratricopeptide repeat protein [Hyphococcus sp.]|uniref:tetratricopeptide repeat protein n=1 Tax=Hyphococcus sp. TaxID=2038636 RepID=UPI003CCC047D
MANDESALREVDQELAEERQWSEFRRQGPLVIGAAIAVVAGVAGWQIWNHVQKSTAEENAIEYSNALEVLAEDSVAGRASLETVAKDTSGYGALAALQRAGSYAAGGERLKAVEIYREIAGGGAPNRVKQLAQLRAGYLSLVDGRDAVIDVLGDLPEAEGRFGYYAREIMALAALDAEDYETAQSSFRQLSLDMSAPEGVRSRAEEFAALASAAKAGVNISGETRLEDLLEAVGDASAPVEDGREEPAQQEENELNDAAMLGEQDAEASGTSESNQDDHDGHDHEE